MVFSPLVKRKKAGFPLFSSRGACFSFRRMLSFSQVLHTSTDAAPCIAGCSLCPLPIRKGVVVIVTYDGLFQYTLVLLTVVSIVLNNKKK